MKRFIIAAALALATTFGAAAQTGETPATIPGVRTIDAAEAQALIARKVKVLDMRRRAAFAEGHLPGAASGSSALDPDTKKLDAEILGTDKAATIVIHGHGSDGWSAFNAAKSAAAQGYTGIHWYRAGFADWTAKGLPVVK